MRRIFACGFAALTLALGAGASTASAAPITQTGLVNINVSDVTVQVPIAVAANICGVQVAALAVDVFQDGTAECNSEAVSDATVTQDAPGDPVTQTGLVNVNVSDVQVQLPVVIAANVCGVQLVALAVEVLQTGTAECDAQGNASAGA